MARPLSRYSSQESGFTQTTYLGGHESHHSWSPFKGPVVFTGPSGLRDHRANLCNFPHALGGAGRSGESTTDLSYICRAPAGQSFPAAKNGRAGEIGWPVDTFKVVKGL